jgi:hypothetical protein
MLKFEIVDGVVRGYATAVVELSFDIDLCMNQCVSVTKAKQKHQKNFST